MPICGVSSVLGPKVSIVRCNLSHTTEVDLIHAPGHNADSGEGLPLGFGTGGCMAESIHHIIIVVRVPSDVQGGATWLTNII